MSSEEIVYDNYVRGFLPSVSSSTANGYSVTHLVTEVLATQQNTAVDLPNLTLLTKIVRLIQSRNLPQYVITSAPRQRLGQGATYDVWKTKVESFWSRFREENKELSVAIKVAQVKVKAAVEIRKGNEAYGTEYRRLQVILFELEVLSRPAIQNHPNVASIMGYSWDETVGGYAPCLVMELATMGDARTFTSSRNLLDDEKLALCGDVARGLSFLHSQSITHGDVKLENILVYGSQMNSVGFVAKISDLERSPLSNTDLEYTGTSLFNAPEVAKNVDVELLPLCDVFSFGLMCFEVLAGIAIHRHTALVSDTAGGDTHKRTCEYLETLSLLSPKLSGICRTVLDSTLQHEPRQRLPEGWETILQLFPSDTFVETNPDMILEIHHNIGSIFDDQLGDIMLRDLQTVLHNSTSNIQRGRAAFDLFFLHTVGRYGINKSIADALELLTSAARYQFGPAFIVGKRIFDAVEQPLPDIFLDGPEDTSLHHTISQLKDLRSENFYSEAVRVLWPPKLRERSLRSLLQFHNNDGIQSDALQPLIERKRAELSVEAFTDYAQKHHLLHYAVANTNYPICQTLLQLGYNVNHPAFSRVTPLNLALRCAEMQIINLLLDHGADSSIMDDDNISPFHWLIFIPQNNVFDVAKRLVANFKGDLSMISSQKTTFKLFLDELDFRPYGTPIQWAIQCRNPTVIQVMLDVNIIPSYDERWPKSYIREAISITCKYCLEPLLERFHHELTTSEKTGLFSDLGVAGSDFSRWLMHGESNRTVYGDVLDLLSRYGFVLPLRSSDMAESEPFTPLCRAVISYHVELVRELLQRGSNVNEICGVHTPLGWSFTSACATGPQHKVTDVVRLLLEHGANTGKKPRLHAACSDDVSVDVVRLVLENDPAAARSIYQGRTPLLHLLDYGIEVDILEKVECLVEAAVDLINEESPHTRPDKEGCCYTPLAYALSYSQWLIADYLLRRGAKFELGEGGGHKHTVLHLMIAQYFGEHDDTKRINLEPIISSLLDHSNEGGQKLVNTLDYNGTSPLGLATYYGLERIVTLIMSDRYKMNTSIIRDVEQQLPSLESDGIPSFVAPDNITKTSDTYRYSLHEYRGSLRVIEDTLKASLSRVF